MSIGWNSSQKMSICPGVVEMTQRFNRISFWVISVILQKQTVKIRCEVVVQECSDFKLLDNTFK